jgi:hypothetical protein
MKTKTCKTCGVTKSYDEFPDGRLYHDGKRPNCKDCRRKYERESYHKHKHKNPYVYEVDKDKKLKKAYGISYQEYLNILAIQQNSCAICGVDQEDVSRAFAVDHCHDTGKIRGLLCCNCNTGIGNLRDDIGLLERAIEYLKNT